MKKSIGIILFFLCIAVILVTGCTSTGSTSAASVATPTPTPTIIPASSIAIATTTIQMASAPITTSPVVTTRSQTIVMQPRGIADPTFVVEVMIPEKIAPGTTLVGDLNDKTRPRIVEVNMLGEVVWEYYLPEELKTYINPGFSAVPLQNGNILAAYPCKGIYEINRTSKTIVWEYIDPKASHDAKRLSNGNTLVVDGGYGRDTLDDPAVVEVNPQGQIVWSWYAKDHGFNQAPFDTINNEGWTHTNAASRLKNGNTLISMRNFNLVAIVDRNGTVVRTLGKDVMHHQHDPQMLPNGNLLFANPGKSPQAVEINPMGAVVWSYNVPEATTFSSQSTRDADRLQNGNTLITSANRLIEVTLQGEIVWQFRLNNIKFATDEDAKSRGFYKAIRIPA
ncbi:MAG: aryl-sulfate sulfotransferase [Methanoregula sp.]